MKPPASSETRRDATYSLANFFAAGFFRGPGQFASNARFSRNKAPFLDEPRPLESFIRPSYTRRTRKSRGPNDKMLLRNYIRDSSRTSHLAGGDFAAGSQRALCTPRDRAGGRGVTFRREVHSAGNLVPQGPSGTCGVGRMRRRGRVPDGLQIGRLTRHETPLALPLALARRSQATKIARPNRFARPFGSIRSQPRRLVIENLSKRYDHRPRQIPGSSSHGDPALRTLG